MSALLCVLRFLFSRTAAMQTFLTLTHGRKIETRDYTKGRIR